MHNLGTVFRFEVARTLKKKSFWIMALLFPVVIGAIFTIIFFSNKATNDAAENTKNQHFSIALTDASGHVSDQVIASVHAAKVADKQTGIDQVKTGKIDAYFYYPASIATTQVEVYAKDVGLFDNSRYDAVAKAILQESVKSTVDAQTTAILKDTVAFTTTTYKDGAPFDGLKQLIAPGIFLILFYILITMFGNQMLTSTIEEKENRVIEMILTTIEARTLIIGKILSLVVLAFIQILIIMIPLIIVYALFHNQLTLPSFDATNIPLDPVRILIGATIFFLSFLLFTGLLVAIGAASPTAKEASSFFGIVMTLIFGPLYAVTLFISSPDAPLVKFLSFFPLTAPIPLMLRNAVGNLSIPDAMIGIAILLVSASLIMVLAIRIFKYGTLEYSKRISLRTLFSTKKSRTPTA